MRESLCHHQHALAILEPREDAPHRLKALTVNFTHILAKLNAMYDEGRRALIDGDFKERLVLYTNHSCDACDRSIDEIRFICLHCRSLQLCEECHSLNPLLNVDPQSTILREHGSNHIFLRVFDFQEVSLTQETLKLDEEDVSVNGKR